MAGVGRPLKYKTVDEIKPLIDKYFEDTPDDELTIVGLALALGTSRSTLLDYQGRDEFSYTIKEAKERIEEAWEKRLIKRGNAGDIFALKNFGWKDKQEIDQKISGDVKLSDLFSKTNDEDEDEDDQES